MISAILLCYNQKRFIKEQFQAILKQDYPGEWEIIISDDFSQDGSFECLEEMVEKTCLDRDEAKRQIMNKVALALGADKADVIISIVDLPEEADDGVKPE